MTSTPAVSVGLPVYNGENYLAQALDSYLEQTLTDFELIISDNASTDATEEICRDYAAQDERVRYVRQARNIGASPNANFLVDQARAALFKWAGHDDIVGSDLLARCVDALDERPDVVLCHSHMGFIDERGGVLGHYDYVAATDSPSAPVRFRSLLDTDGGDDEYGVIRTHVLRRVRPMNSYHNAGRPFVAELALHGPFHQVPQVLFYRREHADRGDRIPSVPALCANLDPRRAGQSTARLMAEYLAGYVIAIRSAPLSTGDRRACYRHLVAWLGNRARPGGGGSTANPPADLAAGGSHDTPPVVGSTR